MTLKITSVTAHRLRAPIGGAVFWSSQNRFPERNSCLIRVQTDGGPIGWGEAGQWGPGEPPAAIAEQVLGPRLIGRDATQPAVIWEELYATTRDFGRAGAYAEAISGIDIALWDIAGQAAGLPIWKLLGGRHRETVEAYATGLYYRDDHDDRAARLAAVEAEAQGFAEAGFRYVKGKIGLLRPDEDLERVARAREVLGPGIGLAMDANHAYSAATAVRVARGLADLGCLFFEEPVMPEDRDGYRKVRAEGGLPIAGGECDATRYGFRELIAGGCVDIAQPDLGACGGFTAFQQIKALAAAQEVLVMPHVWGSGVALAAGLHAVASVAPTPFTARPVTLVNAPAIEFDRTRNPLRDDLLETPFSLTDGALPIPDGPGLGIRLNAEALHRFAA
ncbi:MAG: mandelate racemase/muconate lactonizing enzyme family protein [Pseudomonadota bacterium]